MSSLFYFLCFYLIFFSLRKVEGAKPKIRTKTDNVNRNYCYKMLSFTTDGVIMSSVIGLEEKNKLVSGGVEKEAESIIQHAKQVLERNGSSLDQVYSVYVNLADTNDTQIVDKIFKNHFQEPYPKKTYKQVNGLPLNATIEAEILATLTIEQLFTKADDKQD